MEPVLGLFALRYVRPHRPTSTSLVVLFVLFVLARRIVNSPFGLSLRSVKGNPLRASAIGIPVNGRLVAIYTIAAGYAGVAGALLAQTTHSPRSTCFDFERSADVLLVLIIGGTGYLYGGLIGAIIFKLVQDYLANVDAAILAVLARPRAGDDGPVRPRLWRRHRGVIFGICTALQLPFMHSIVLPSCWSRCWDCAAAHSSRHDEIHRARGRAARNLKARFARKGGTMPPVLETKDWRSISAASSRPTTCRLLSRRARATR